MNGERKLYILIITACVLSVLSGLAFGYLLFGGASVNANIHTRADEVVPTSGTVNEVVTIDGFAEDVLPRYVVTAVNGYVAVFYADHAGGGIMETTTIPLNVLPEYDILRLTQGIYIYTDEALARILQDYGS
jgi:hypothetical protein